MIYKENKDGTEYFYEVSYEEAPLQTIMKELKGYQYTLIGKAQVGGDITKWPATKKNIQKRICSRYSEFCPYTYCHNFKLLPETIIYHTENNNSFVTFEYLFSKFPDLYYYIDVMINDKNIFIYQSLFEANKKVKSYNPLITNKEQIIIDKLLNYINSSELVNHNSEINDEKYDYKGLNELYKRTLNCLKFTLIAKKEYLDNPQETSYLSLQKRKLKNNYPKIN